MYALPSNIEYTGLNKAILDSAYASPNIAFLRPAYSILDGKASNIIYMWDCVNIKTEICTIICLQVDTLT